MHLIHNEQTKLTATLLNALATALVATGFLAPVAALLYGLSQIRIGLGYTAALALGCLTLGGALHVTGRIVLRRLQE
jgi:hypothetical protein